MTKVKYYSDFLFPGNDAITGLGSLLNFWGGYFLYNSSRNESDADKKAILADWLITGRDLSDAADEVKRDYETNTGKQLEFDFK